MSVRKSTGNMYPWVSHTHTHLRGECPHGCKYCYVRAMERRFCSDHYAGPLRLDEKELCCSYDTPAIRRYAQERGFERPVIFIEHCNDLFAREVPDDWIKKIFEHCLKYYNVDFVFQTKNTQRMCFYQHYMPKGTMFSTTVESDAEHDVYKADILSCVLRLEGISDISRAYKTFVTVEPVLRMKNPIQFARDIASCHPDFVNIGADSKGHGLPEPSRDQLLAFIGELQRLGVEIRQKTNLERLLA